MAADQADVLARGTAATARACRPVAVADFAAAAVARARGRAAAHVGVAALARLRAAELVAGLLKATSSILWLLPGRLRPARVVREARNERCAGRRGRQRQAGRQPRRLRTDKGVAVSAGARAARFEHTRAHLVDADADGIHGGDRAHAALHVCRQAIVPEVDRLVGDGAAGTGKIRIIADAKEVGRAALAVVPLLPRQRESEYRVGTGQRVGRARRVPRTAGTRPR